MQFNELKQLVITAIEDLKGENIIELDVRNKTSVTDLMLVVSGGSSRHVKAIANNVILEAKKAGHQPLGVEGEAQAEWVLVDLGDIVLHVMQYKVREFYELEKLWAMDEAPDKQSVS
jgi:ribosome-associated protein